MLQHKLCHHDTALFIVIDGDDSEDEEEVDSNHDGESLQSERTDKDEEACESKPQATYPLAPC